MPAGRPCKVCSHPHVAAINSRLAGGTPLRRIEAEFGVPIASLSRHANQHLGVPPARPDTAGRANTAYQGVVARTASIEDLTARLERLYDRLDGRLARDGDGLPAVAETQVVREMRGCIADLARLTGQDRGTPAVAVQVNSALSADPDAVAAALVRMLGTGRADDVAARLLDAADAAG